MAFQNNAIIFEQDDAGWQTAITGATAAHADGNFSVAGTNATITEIDNSTLKAKYYKAAFQGQMATITSVQGKKLELWLRDMQANGTNEVMAPTTTVKNGARLVGAFVVPTAVSNTDFYASLIFPTFGIQAFELMLYNDCGQSIFTGYTVKVLGLADKPK